MRANMHNWDALMNLYTTCQTILKKQSAQAYSPAVIGFSLLASDTDLL